MKTYTILFKRVLSVLLLVFLLLPIQAQQVQDALYIFRNDGTFNAFFYADIVRIGYSRVDTFGVEHDDVVVQEIEALDTLYRIPLTAIDSVAFVTPENKVKADVTLMTALLTDYIVASDSTSWFRLSPSAPASIVPKVGDKLLIEDPAPYLPDGFSGRVTSVSQTSDGITVNTEAVGLFDLFDRYVAKAAGSSTEPRSGIRRAGGDDVWKTHLDISYQTAEPIIIPPLTGNFNFTGSGEFIKDFASLDGVGTFTYAFTPHVDIRVFLYADAVYGIKYHHEVRWSGDESATTNIAGIVTGHIDIPATFPAEAVSKMKDAALKKAGKELVKKLSTFDVVLSFGVFLEGQGSMNKSLTLQRTNARHLDVVNYIAPAYSEPSLDYLQLRSSIKSDRDTVICSGWAGKLTFNVGLYGKAYIKKPWLKREWELAARLEGGVRLEEEPAVAVDAITNVTLEESSKLYTLLNREDDVHLNLFANVQGYLKLGWFTPLNLKPEVTTDHLGLYGIVPDISRVQWNIDKLKPWQGTLTSPVRRDLLFSVPVGFAIFDEDNKQVASWWNPVDYWHESVYTLYQNTFDKLETGKIYTAYPQIKLYGAILLTDQNTEFTLGPAFINIDKDKKVFTDYDKRLLEVDEKINFRDVELLTNIANTEMEVPANANWIFNHYWDKDEACVKLSIDDLPDDIDRREAVIRFVGRDSTGTKELAKDSIVVRQIRPFIKATPSPVEFKKEGGTQTVALVTSLDQLTAWIVKETNPGNFCSIKLEQDKDGNWTIAITVAENKDAEARTASIVVDGESLSGQKEQLIFYVNQEGTESDNEEEDPTLPDTDILPGTPYDGLKYINYTISMSRKGSGSVSVNNDYSVANSQIQATIDGRYIYVLLDKEGEHIYLKIDNESIDKNIVGGRVSIQQGSRSITMALGKIPNWFHNRRKIDYVIYDLSDYDSYDPNGFAGMRCSYPTGAGLAKFVKELYATDGENVFTLLDESMHWDVRFYLGQYSNDSDNEYDNDHQDFEWTPKFPPKSMVNELKQLGMVINTGSTPPAIDGAFEITPLEAVGQKGYDSYVESGRLNNLVEGSQYVKYSDLSGNTIMFDNGAFYANVFHEGPYPVAIQGSGNKFTTSFVRKSWNAWQMYIFSGEVDGNTLKNVYGATVRINDDYTIQRCIIYKESDAVSDAFDWNSVDWRKK